MDQCKIGKMFIALLGQLIFLAAVLSRTWAVGSWRGACEHGLERAGPGVALGEELLEVEDLLHRRRDGRVLVLRRWRRSIRPMDNWNE